MLLIHDPTKRCSWEMFFANEWGGAGSGEAAAGAEPEPEPEPIAAPQAL